MQVFDSIPEMRAFLEEHRRAGKRIGLVPTMGALHDGHLSLVRASVAECDVTVVSIFVNPLQFEPHEDLERYPRDLEGDARLLEPIGASAIFTAAVDAMYPEGYRTYVVQDGLYEPLCGGSRPGHFRGVATVVSKLFHIIWPHAAFFGQKDAQQCIVLKRMIDDLDFPIEMRVVPTSRETDGLAMSSRNLYLNEKRRAEAPSLYRALTRAREMFDAGERSTAKLLAGMDEVFAAVPDVEVDYREIVDLKSLQRIDVIEDRALAAVAAQLGPSRLIDNLVLGGNDLPNGGLW